MSVAAALRDGTERLAKTSDTARLDAELLMAHALGMGRSDMLLRHMQSAAPTEFAALLERRERHEPVAYIIGVQEFYGREFAVRPGVLIPRSDSETVLEVALDNSPNPTRVLDCGTGPGTLLLSFLAERPNAQGVGIDISTIALELAKQNAEQLALESRVKFLHRDWKQPNWRDGLGLFDLIISNPPYVEEDANLAHDVRGFEPAEALFSGPAGLDDYRRLIPQLGGLLAESGYIVLEIGSTQAEPVTQISKQAGFSAQLHNDLGNRPRALVLNRND